MSKRGFFKTKGPEHGQCNICGDIGPLTEDHSPPKSCVRPRAMEIRHVIDMLCGDGPQKRSELTQNGVKFRTLCAYCNNDYLGARYDPALANFTNRTSAVLKSPLALPKTIEVPMQPQQLMRAVWGHIAAQGVARYQKGPQTETLRDWFFDETQRLPPTIRFYYWAFPHSDNILFRDAGLSHPPSGQIANLWLMKFFPVAFLIAFESGEHPMFNLPCLTDLPPRDPAAVVDVRLPLTPQVPHHWPEAPSEDSFVMYGQEAIASSPYTSKASRR